MTEQLIEIGKRLLTLREIAGLTQKEASGKLEIPEAEYAELIEDMKATYACGEYLCMSPYYIYVGRKK